MAEDYDRAKNQNDNLLKQIQQLKSELTERQEDNCKLNENLSLLLIEQEKHSKIKESFFKSLQENQKFIDNFKAITFKNNFTYFSIGCNREKNKSF